jgi:hypothetical protein
MKHGPNHRNTHPNATTRDPNCVISQSSVGFVIKFQSQRDLKERSILMRSGGSRHSRRIGVTATAKWKWYLDGKCGLKSSYLCPLTSFAQHVPERLSFRWGRELIVCVSNMNWIHWSWLQVVALTKTTWSNGILTISPWSIIMLFQTGHKAQIEHNRATKNPYLFKR